MNAISFKKFINDILPGEIDKKIEEYISSNAEDIYYKADRLDSCYYIDYSSYDLKTVWADELSPTSVKFYIVVAADFVVYGKRGKQTDQDQDVTEWFMLTGEGDLLLGRDSFEIYAIEVYEEKQYRLKPLDDLLVPELSKNDIENCANSVIEKYYPELLQTPQKADLGYLASKLGLGIYDSFKLSKDSSVIGQCFFKDGITTLYDSSLVSHEYKISQGTILIDISIPSYSTYVTNRFTICHEIGHFILHKMRILLECLMDDSMKGLQCKNDGLIQNKTGYEYANMEFQANYIAACLLAPREPFMKKANEIIGRNTTINPSDMIADFADSLIEELSDFFGMSKQATKIRLINCGYHTIQEAMTYINGKFVHPISFKKHSLAYNETYSISIEDFAFELMFNPELNELFKKGKLVYVDFHVCINDPKYIEKNSVGMSVLSEYAKANADECLLKFKIVPENEKKYGSSKSQYCVLFREICGIDTKATFSKEANKSMLQKANAILDRNIEVSKLMSLIIPDSFSKSLVNLMKEAGITIDKLAGAIGVSNQTINNYRANVNDPEQDNLYAICIALDFPYEVSIALLKTVGYSVRMDERGQIIDFCLKNSCCTILECNELLISKGLTPITKNIDSKRNRTNYEVNNHTITLIDSNRVKAK